MSTVIYSLSGGHVLPDPKSYSDAGSWLERFLHKGCQRLRRLSRPAKVASMQLDDQLEALMYHENVRQTSISSDYVRIAYSVKFFSAQPQRSLRLGGYLSQKSS